MEKVNLEEKQTHTVEQHIHHHHHHHHHHGMDDSELFKQHQLKAQRIRKLTTKVVFYLLVIIAVLVMLAVWYVYTH